MIAVFPVSDSLRHVHPSTEVDAPNIGNELVYVPVCIRFIYTNPGHSCHLIRFMI
jgi:hypothetical protein